MRGRLQREAARAARPRRIPARAGPTLPRRPSASFRSEDPRVRGVDARISGAVFAASGGSPRARGRRPPAGSRGRAARRIPAHAGSTFAHGLSGSKPEEDPRARGRLQVRREGPRRPRRIPACAGPTRRCTGDRRPPPEDPRVRGANYKVRWTGGEGVGRSPRARGRPARRAAGPGVHRKIPTCAGSTPNRRQTTSATPEDPRVRGVDPTPAAAGVTNDGRSPRARGRLLTSSSPLARCRKIPACAGSTPRGPGRGWRWREDPRVRGVDLILPATQSSGVGRSPRARGRHRREQERTRAAGKIPACAGSTLVELRSYRLVCQFSFSCFPTGDTELRTKSTTWPHSSPIPRRAPCPWRPIPIARRSPRVRGRCGSCPRLRIGSSPTGRRRFPGVSPARWVSFGDSSGCLCRSGGVVGGAVYDPVLESGGGRGFRWMWTSWC